MAREEIKKDRDNYYCYDVTLRQLLAFFAILTIVLVIVGVVGYVAWRLAANVVGLLS